MAGNVGKVCLKCQYRRAAEDAAPEYECPQCGAVYAKVEAALRRPSEGEAPAEDPQSIYRPPGHPSEDPPGRYAEVKVLSPRGRIGRLRYVAYQIGLNLAFVPVVAILAGVGAAVSQEAGGVMLAAGMMIFYLALLVLFVMWTIRRLHDINLSGWFSFLFVFISFVLWFIPGTKGENRFGPMPPPNPAGVIVLACFMGLVPVLGVLAAIALPAYQDYVVRAKVQQATQLGYDLRARADRYRVEHGRLPAGLVALGLPEDLSGPAVAAVDIQEGVISVYLDASSAVLEGHFIMLAPETGAGEMTWTCQSSLDDRYLPADCR